MEFDFSATPKTEGGALFPWIIVDFSLKEAIEMNIVKLPLKGIVKKAEEIASTKAKDKRATQWCKDTTSLTGENWTYMRVNQEDFERYRFKSFKELFSTQRG